MAERGVSSPSGGGRASSDIFNTSDQPSPARKVRDNQKSSIVNTGVGIDPNGNLKRANSPRHQDNTKNRLFGANGDSSNGGDFSPRRNNDTWRSNIMFTESDGQTLPDGTKRTPKKRFPSGGMNPITGTPSRGQMNGHTPTHMNGGMNGMNGYDHHDDVLTVTYGSEGHGPIAVLNGHGGDHASPRHRAAQVVNSQ